jgi:hypothetical protein
MEIRTVCSVRFSDELKMSEPLAARYRGAN